MAVTVVRFVLLTTNAHEVSIRFFEVFFAPTKAQLIGRLRQFATALEAPTLPKWRPAAFRPPGATGQGAWLKGKAAPVAE